MRCFLVCTVLFAHVIVLAQGAQNHFSSTFFEKQVFAHRGGYAFGPENTWETIRFNLKRGVTAIEVDVAMTKDEKLILFHDNSLTRILDTEDTRPLEEFTLAELKSFNLRDERLGKVRITTLEELVDSLATIIPNQSSTDFLLELDFKPSGEQTEVAVSELLRILNANKPNHGEILYNYFFVSTFYPEVLKELENKDDKVKKAFAVMNNATYYKVKTRLAILFAGYFVRKNNADIIEPNLCMITKRFVTKWHNKGLLINTYTANSKCEKEYLKQFGVALTTDCPLEYCPTDEDEKLRKPRKWCRTCRKLE